MHHPLREMAAKIQPQPGMRSEIHIADFDFDINNDGNLDTFEKEVQKLFKNADRDGSGTITPVEMIEIMRTMSEGKKAAKRMGRSIMGLIALVFTLIIALVGVSISGAMVGGEAIKESKVPDCSDPAVAAVAGKCDEGKMVRVGAVESFVDSVFDLPKVPTNQLAYIRDVTFYADMTSDASVGGPVEATFKVAGAFKRSDTQAWLRTTDGNTIVLDAAAQTGTLTMANGGPVFPLSSTPPTSSTGRRLETAADAPMVATKTGRQLAESHAARGRELGFSGGLMTSGSFTMMAASGLNRRRELSFSGSLMTSGSFTMMAATILG